MNKLFFTGFLIVLFVSSLFLLFFRLDSYPQGLYNWENYSIWRIFQRQHGELPPPFDNYLSLTQGLMTDSGLSPLIGIPAAFMFNNFGADLFSLRFWNASVGIITVLLFFLITRRLFGFTIAVFASLYLLFSPVFLLYIRTATNVGISLVFSLITIYLLSVVWKYPKRIINYVLLALSLAINSYLYAPIRFLLPLALFLLIWQVFSINKQIVQKNLKKTAFVIFGFLAVIFLLSNIPVISDAFVSYYKGRGEQVFTKYAETKELQEKGVTSLLPILTKNTTDLGKLYLNIDTKPAVTDYWNPQGQILNTFLVPFFLLGLIVALIQVRKTSYALLLLWFAVTTFPIVLTNNVHIGRLIFSLPPLFILVGVGMSSIITYTVKLFPYKRLHYIVIGTLVAGSLILEVSPYFSKQLPIDNYISHDNLEELEIGTSDLYLFNVDSESLRFWTAYFYLHDSYTFVDLNDPERVLNGKENADFVIYFLEESATQENILHYCTQSALPVLLAGHPDPTFLTLPCKNTMMQI